MRRFNWFEKLLLSLSVSIVGAFVTVGVLMMIVSPGGSKLGGSRGGSERGAMMAGRAANRLLDPATRMAEIERIAGSGDRSLTPLVGHYAVRAEDADFRRACIGALGRLKDEAATQPLSVILDAGPAEFRADAAQALGRVEGERATQVLLSALAQKQAEVRAAAVASLAMREGDMVIEGLLRGLADPEELVRGAAVHGLARHSGLSRAQEGLVKAMDDPAPEIRLEAVQALTGAPTPTAQAGIARACGDADASVRAVGLAAARRIGPPMVAVLGTSLGRTDDPQARLQVAQLLGNMGGEAKADVLLNLLADTPPGRRRADPAAEEAVFRAVVDGLAAMGTGVVARVVELAIDGELDPRAERAAAAALTHIGSACAKPVSDAICRWRVFPDPSELPLWIDALGRMGSAAARPALCRALAQNVAGVEQAVAAAAAAVEAATGASLGTLEPDFFDLTGVAGPAAGSRLRATAPVGVTHLVSGSLPADALVRLDLKGALPGGREARLTLVRRDGRWEREFWAAAFTYNKRIHAGRLTGADTGAAVGFECEIAYRDDSWVSGGLGSYSLRLEGVDRGTVRGTFVGAFNGRPLAGSVTGTVFAVAWPSPPCEPLAAGEHPRILFRKRDLPLLRERVKTAFGKAVVAAIRSKLAADKLEYAREVNWVTTWESGMDAAIGHGFLAEVFGDAGHGRRAVALVMERVRVPPYHGEHGERLPRPLLIRPVGYDMAYAYMTPEQRSNATAVVGFYNGIYNDTHGLMGSLAGGNPPGFGVQGMTALAVFREPGPFELPEPVKPRAVVTLSPAGPKTGAPVNALTEGAALTNWVMAAAGEGVDGEAVSAAVRDVGLRDDRLQVGQGVLAFSILPAAAVRDTPGMGAGWALAVAGAAPAAPVYLYTQLELAADRGVAFSCAHPLAEQRPRVWMDGVCIEHDSALLLPAGRHDLLIEARAAAVTPVFTGYDTAAAAARVKQWEWLHARWEAARAQHARTGERPGTVWALEETRRGVWYWMQESKAVRFLIQPAPLGKGYGAHNTQTPLSGAVWTALAEPLSVTTPVYGELFGPEVVSRMSTRDLAFTMHLADDRLAAVLAGELVKRVWPDDLQSMTCMDLIAALANMPGDGLPGGIPPAP